MGQGYSTGQKEMKEPKTNLAAENEMMRIIECPVCQEVPFPPIFQCVTGHNVCKKCRPKLKECPVCKEVITDKRNYTVEALVQTYKHSCFNKSAGCDNVTTGELMEDHLKLCEYRPHPCPLIGCRGCQETVLQIPGYKKHFRSAHDINLLYGSDITVKYSFEAAALLGSNIESWGCCPILLEFDGNTFLITMLIDYHSRMIYWSVACIGVEKEADKYGAQIILTTQKARRVQLSWTLRVSSILKGVRRADAVRNDVFQPPCTFQAFEKFIQRSSDSADEKQYFATTKYIIHKFKS